MLYNLSAFDINDCYYFHRTMIQNMIKEGKIVPSEVTIKLLQRAMLESGNDKFLIDGFPRNEENRAAFENVVSLRTSIFSCHVMCSCYHSLYKQFKYVHLFILKSNARFLVALCCFRQK